MDIVNKGSEVELFLSLMCADPITSIKITWFTENSTETEGTYSRTVAVPKDLNAPIPVVLDTSCLALGHVKAKIDLIVKRARGSIKKVLVRDTSVEVVEDTRII